MLRYLLIYSKISFTKTQTCKLTFLNKRIRKVGHKTVGNFEVNNYIFKVQTLCYVGGFLIILICACVLLIHTGYFVV